MNNTNDRLDCLIGLAMFDCAKEYEEEYDAIDTSNVVIDERFDKRIYRLIGKKEREPKVRKIKKISFRVAVAAMLIMSVMLLTMLLISGVREAIWNAIVKWYDDHIAVSFVQPPLANEEESYSTDNIYTGDTTQTSETLATSEPESTENIAMGDTTPILSYPQKILEYRKPSVSDEYTEIEMLKDTCLFMVDYYIGEEWVFGFNQNVKSDDEQKYDNTDIGYEEIMINEFPAVIFISEPEDLNMITWSDGEYLYTISGYLNKTELIYIAESVK